MGKLRLHFRMLKPDLDSPMKVRREATGSVVLISVAASTVRAGFLRTPEAIVGLAHPLMPREPHNAVMPGMNEYMNPAPSWLPNHQSLRAAGLRVKRTRLTTTTHRRRMMGETNRE
jgi:hypothetical protein